MGGSHCPVHKFEGHKRRKVCHALGLHIVFEVQVGGQGAGIVERDATGTQLGAEDGCVH